MPRLPLILLIAGVAAAVFSQLGAVTDLTLFGVASDIQGPLGLGPEWAHRVPDVAGGLGISAALCGVIQWRWPDRAVAVIVAVLLVLGTAFVGWWLLAPPEAVLLDGESFSYDWWLWVSAAGLGVAAVAATALALRAEPPTPG